MHEELINQLKTLKSITPEKGFVSRTRTIFEPQKALFSNSVFLQYAGAFAVFIIAVLAIPLLLLPEPTVASLDTESISSEISSLPINVQLKEIHYSESVQNTISDAITEVATSDTNHLNSSLLEKEEQNVPTNTTEINNNVDNLLDQVIK